MIEAVDWRDLPGYFAALHRLVGDHGLVGLQAIVIGDDRYDRARVATNFIKAQVFPGGCLPSVGTITRTAAETGPLDVVDLEDLGLHYARPWPDGTTAWTSSATSCRTWAWTSASPGSGPSTCATARRPFSNVTSASCRPSSPAASGGTQGPCCGPSEKFVPSGNPGR